MGLLVGLAVLAATCIGSLLLPVLVLLILPSRKGTMRTVRELMVPGQPEDVWNLIAGRLEYEGFQLDAADWPNRLTARCAAKPYQEAGQRIVTHATKPLGAEATFVPMPDGVRVTLALWMRDFIFYDSGEGRQITSTLDRLISARLDEEEPPVTTSMAFGAICAIFGGVIALTFSALPLRTQLLSGPQLLGYGLGVCGAGFYAVMMARTALAAINARPKEVTGKTTVAIAIALGVMAIVPGLWWAISGWKQMAGIFVR